MSQYNYKLIIAYDGTEYSGWQVQTNSRSIQEIIQQILSTILQEEIKVIGSGRTDAGVHALGQVAHFKTFKEINTPKVLGSLNALLPMDIRILSLEAASSEFHAQYGAIGKVYRYHLFLNTVSNPFRRHYHWQIKSPLQLSKMREAASCFLGTHDFAAFANEAHSGVAAYDSIRTIKRIDIFEEDGELKLEFEGDGFLYKMVRNIVGTLVEVGRGKVEPEDIPFMIASKDRRQAGMAAPPTGLFLVRVDYKDSTCNRSSKL